mmetsp:Transcript_25768/g.29671  ORF Transcript_25768/g.29671 Transcript_25768/m.29671 type:complete len:191 (+) Transcript_25768:756-1328(+)
MNEFFPVEYRNPAIINFFISPKKTRIEEYILYQPQASRMLETASANTTSATTNSTKSVTIEAKEVNSDALYQALHVMAQLGGLYSFLKLVFGSVLGVLYEKLMKMEIINALNSKKDKKRVSRMNNYKTIDLQTSKIKPIGLIEESKQKSYNKINEKSDYKLNKISYSKSKFELEGNELPDMPNKKIKYSL